ncbi:hypothetical protein B0J18DRAFT_403841 [Chaetomium sp. MPI-SDFR-AT-0129]|nr:hypothetical protein B0J18DRAFT_403841 [Chaetomium sp. MPI-SDFR-AT-0129]
MFWAKSVSFDAAKDIPSLEGKVILVSGASSGLGKQAVLEYAQHNPRLIYLGARSADKANAAAKEIKEKYPKAAIEFLELDVASFASVKKAAATVLSTTDRLDILMLNAGIMAHPPGLTADGYELQIGTNHMGHALLTKLLLPLLLKTAAGTTTDGSQAKPSDVRVVTVASNGHIYATAPGIHFQTLRTPADEMGPLGRYFQSKLANVLWTRQLAALYPSLTVVSMHPGTVQTNLMNNTDDMGFFMRGLTKGLVKMNAFTPVEKGVRSQLWASVAPRSTTKDGKAKPDDFGKVVSGEYYEPVGVSGKMSALGRDDELTKKFWEWTEKELAGHVA